jgi:hypothetical protein
MTLSAGTSQNEGEPVPTASDLVESILLNRGPGLSGTRLGGGIQLSSFTAEELYVVQPNSAFGGALFQSRLLDPANGDVRRGAGLASALSLVARGVLDVTSEESHESTSAQIFGDLQLIVTARRRPGIAALVEASTNDGLSQRMFYGFVCAVKGKVHKLVIEEVVGSNSIHSFWIRTTDDFEEIVTNALCADEVDGSRDHGGTSELTPDDVEKWTAMERELDHTYALTRVLCFARKSSRLVQSRIGIANVPGRTWIIRSAKVGETPGRTVATNEPPQIFKSSILGMLDGQPIISP